MLALETLTKSVDLASLKNGGVKYLDRKSYGIKHGLKGAALNRAHYAYRMDEWLPAVRAVAAVVVSSKDQFVASIALNKSGGANIRTVATSKVKAPKGAAEARAAKAAQAELAAAQAEIEKLRAQLAASK